MCNMTGPQSPKPHCLAFSHHFCGQIVMNDICWQAKISHLSINGFFSLWQKHVAMGKNLISLAFIILEVFLDLISEVPLLVYHLVYHH